MAIRSWKRQSRLAWLITYSPEMVQREIGAVLPYLSAIPDPHKFAKAKVKSKTMSRARNWCFTLNNPSIHEILKLEQLYDDHGESAGVRYLIFQQETGQEGTPHVQGFISLEKQKRIKQLKTLVGDRAHLEMARGTPQQNIDYCSKTETAVEGTLRQYGEPPPPQRKRSDLEDFKAAVLGGERDVKRLRLDHSKVFANSTRFALDFIADHAPEIEVEDHEFFPWQQEVIEYLRQPANDREILFVVDPKGGKGKTWFAKKFTQQNPDDVQYMEPGKKADMAYMLNPNIKCLFLNISRSFDEDARKYLYSFLESVKDGMVFSPKYESRMKLLGKVHVVVMMNEMPDKTKLSSDRYVIHNI